VSGVLEFNDLKKFTLPMVEAARGSLVIGTARHIVNSGMVLDDSGNLRSLDNVEWRQRRQELARLGGAPW
jgi:hypothetical protein